MSGRPFTRTRADVPATAPTTARTSSQRARVASPFSLTWIHATPARAARDAIPARDASPGSSRPLDTSVRAALAPVGIRACESLPKLLHGQDEVHEAETRYGAPRERAEDECPEQGVGVKQIVGVPGVGPRKDHEHQAHEGGAQGRKEDRR